MNDPDATSGAKRHSGTAGEVFAAFLKLGVTAFGGPIAHLGYFRSELVVRRRWIDEKGYADLVALCQFLPGPASSQVGFALGLLRGGPMGAAAAWAAFTLPSAVLLVLFALAANASERTADLGAIHGLKVVAVAIVAQAIWGMAKTLCPDRTRAGIALTAVLIVIFAPGAFAQVAAILVGGLAGLLMCRPDGETISGHLTFAVSRTTGTICLLLYALLLFGLPIAAAAFSVQGITVFDSFYRAGALVFGGGHVVLPLLQSGVVSTGWVSTDTFLSGYGAAQAVPGPLFTFAAYLGASLGPEPNGLFGATIALFAIFLPGFLLLIGAMPFWDALRAQPNARGFMRGSNAAVVGILGAALYQPIWTSAVGGPHEFALALACFLLLMVWKAPSWAVVLVATLGGIAIGRIA